jgi:hypothetical protein
MANYNEEVVRKTAQLARDRFAGDYRRMFDHYARKLPRTAQLNSDELAKLFEDADIGHFLTRGQWASGVIAELDANRDGFISYMEFRQLPQFSR